MASMGCSSQMTSRVGKAMATSRARSSAAEISSPVRLSSSNAQRRSENSSGLLCLYAAMARRIASSNCRRSSRPRFCISFPLASSSCHEEALAWVVRSNVAAVARSERVIEKRCTHTYRQCEGLAQTHVELVCLRSLSHRQCGIQGLPGESIDHHTLELRTKRLKQTLRKILGKGQFVSVSAGA